MQILDFYKNFWQINKKLFVRFLYLFFASILLGVVVSRLYPDFAAKIMEELEKLVGVNPELNFAFAWFIFVHNLKSELIVLAGGLIFGLAPVLVIAFTGFAIGILTDYIFTTWSVPLLTKINFMLAALLPHGIFEIPIVILTCILGWRLGTDLIKKPAEGLTRKAVFKYNLKSILYFLPLIVILTFIAALIEVFITPFLAGLVL